MPCSLGWCALDGAAADVSFDGDPPDVATPDADGGLDVVDAAIDAPAACDDGQARCNGSCVDTMADPMHCGACIMACPAGPGAVATCTAGVCGSTCRPGFERYMTGCDPIPPRPLAPLSTATVTRARPTLHWVPAAGLEGASVEICRARTCDGANVVHTLDVAGAAVAPPSDLAPGTWFWRVRGRARGVVGVRTSAVWQFTVGARSTAVDSSWGATLDVNGDGFADAAIAAGGAAMSAGRVYVFHGSASGLGAMPAAVLESPDTGVLSFARSVAAAGDVNGDGYGDLAVGGSMDPGNVGRIHVFLGGPLGVARSRLASLTSPDGADPRGATYFGDAVASAGDVNRDGYADLVAGAGRAGNNAGRVYIFHGAPTGPLSMPAATVLGPDGAETFFGWRVVGAADFNGDGFSDVAASTLPATSEGRVYVLAGSASGVSPMRLQPIDAPSAMREHFGNELAVAGDVTGDGYTDLLAGADWAAANTGRVHLFAGSSSGLMPRPLASVSGGDEFGLFGRVASTAGDVDGDGHSDVVVAAPGALMSSGRVVVLRGSSTGLVTPSVASIAGSDGVYARFGAALGRGDFDGDGFSDVLVGAPGTTVGGVGGVGRVAVFLGSARGTQGVAGARIDGRDGADGAFGAALPR